MFMEYQIIIKLIRTEQECLEAASFDDWNENDKLLLEKLAHKLHEVSTRLMKSIKNWED